MFCIFSLDIAPLTASPGRASNRRATALCRAALLGLWFGAIAPAPAGVRAEEPRRVKLGTIHNRDVRESSGLAASRRNPGVMWTLNDSGGPPRLYAFDAKGRSLAEVHVAGALNVDWESLAADDHSHLYVGDVGNNAIPGGFVRRWVYRVTEPEVATEPADVASPASDAAQKNNASVRSVPTLTANVEATFFYAFPANEHPFDVEAMFVRDDNLYLIAKVAKGPSRVYRLPLDNPDDATTLVEVDRLPGTSMVTGADLSPDGRRLAICSYDYAAVYELGPQPFEGRLEQTPAKIVTYSRAGIEACCWQGNRLILSSENSELFAIEFKDLQREADENASPSPGLRPPSPGGRGF